MSQYGEREATQCKPLKKALSAWVWSRDTCLSHLFQRLALRRFALAVLAHTVCALAPCAISLKKALDRRFAQPRWRGCAFLPYQMYCLRRRALAARLCETPGSHWRP